MSSETENMKARNLLDMALLQCAAESYLHQVDFLGGSKELAVVLKAGSNNIDFMTGDETPDKDVLGGATRMTSTQFAYFEANFRIVAHYPNDVSGFSGTLFQSKKGSIAFRVDCPLCEAVALGRLCGWNNSSHTHWV